MKIRYIAVALLALVKAQAEPVFVYDYPGTVHVLGLNYDGGEISPILVHFSPYNGPAGTFRTLSLKSAFSMDLQTQIPSALFGDSMAVSDSLHGVVNMAGKDIELYAIVMQSWLETEFLGRVFPREYPIVYVKGLGWIYLHAYDSGKYFLYAYHFEKWFDLDLEQLWTDRHRTPQDTVE